MWQAGVFVAGSKEDGWRDAFEAVNVLRCRGRTFGWYVDGGWEKSSSNYKFVWMGHKYFRKQIEFLNNARQIKLNELHVLLN